MQPEGSTLYWHREIPDYLYTCSTEVSVLPEPTIDRTQNGEPARVVPATKRTIFRAEAHQHYVQNQEKVAVPRLASPQAFGYLWVLALLLMIAGSLIAFWPLIEPYLR